MDYLDKWTADGLFEPSAMIDRLFDGRDLDHYLPLSSEAFSSETAELDEAAFIRLILRNAALPPNWSNFGRMIYRSIVTMITAPLYPHPSYTPPPSLPALALQRALSWLIPNMRARFSGWSTTGREQTRADEWRMLFQSLATATQDVPSNPQEARQRAVRNAPLLASIYGPAGDLVVNYDEDGDEVFHDVLDAIFASTGDLVRPGRKGPTRDNCRELAKGMAKALPRLHTLGIPVDEFTIWVTYLVVLQFDYRPKGLEDLDLSKYKTTVESIVALFFGGIKNASLITWPLFNDAIIQVPFLFEPLFRTLQWGFLNHDIWDIVDIQAPSDPKATESLLPPPRMSQLGTILYNDIKFSCFDRAHLWNEGVRPQAAVLLRVMETMPGLSLLVMSGLAPSTGENYLFGLFRPSRFDVKNRIKDTNPNSPRTARATQPRAVWRDYRHDGVDYETEGFISWPLVIVLSPVHRVFRLDGNACISEDGSLVAGDCFKFMDDGSAMFGNGDEAIKVITNVVEVWGEAPTKES